MTEKSSDLTDDKNRAVIRDGMLCTRCLEKVIPKLEAKGSTGVEIVLWLFFLVPGLIYSIWRRAEELRICPSCGSQDLVPFQSERAKSVLGDSKWQEIISLRKTYTENDDRSWEV